MHKRLIFSINKLKQILLFVNNGVLFQFNSVPPFRYNMYTQNRASGKPLRIMCPSYGLKLANTGLKQSSGTKWRLSISLLQTVPNRTWQTDRCLLQVSIWRYFYSPNQFHGSTKLDEDTKQTLFPNWIMCFLNHVSYYSHYGLRVVRSFSLVGVQKPQYHDMNLVTVKILDLVCHTIKHWLLEMSHKSLCPIFKYFTLIQIHYVTWHHLCTLTVLCVGFLCVCTNATNMAACTLYSTQAWNPWTPCNLAQPWKLVCFCTETVNCELLCGEGSIRRVVSYSASAV